MCEITEKIERTDSSVPEKTDVDGDSYRLHGRERGTEDTYFLLKDRVHEFTLGLSDILDCLKFAETEGMIPPVPVPWWFSLADMYQGHEDWTDLAEKKNKKRQ